MIADMKKYTVLNEYIFYSEEEIINALNDSKYKDRYFLIDTNIGQNSDHIRPNNAFEEKLKKSGVKYFAYIKFFIDKGISYGIVAGKTGSSLVNLKSDINFSTNEKDGYARRFLKKKNLNWDKSKILVIKPEVTTDKLLNKKEALAIERDLKKKFNLLGS